MAVAAEMGHRRLDIVQFVITFIGIDDRESVQGLAKSLCGNASEGSRIHSARETERDRYIGPQADLERSLKTTSCALLGILKRHRLRGIKELPIGIGHGPAVG